MVYGGEVRELTAKEQEGTLLSGRNALYLNCGDGCITVYICQNSNFTMEWVNFIVCKLFLIKLFKSKTIVL